MNFERCCKTRTEGGEEQQWNMEICNHVHCLTVKSIDPICCCTLALSHISRRCTHVHTRAHRCLTCSRRSTGGTRALRPPASPPCATSAASACWRPATMGLRRCVKGGAHAAAPAADAAAAAAGQGQYPCIIICAAMLAPFAQTSYYTCRRGGTAASSVLLCSHPLLPPSYFTCRRGGTTASSVLPPFAHALILHVPQGRHHCIICAPTLCSRPHFARAAGAAPLHHLCSHPLLPPSYCTCRRGGTAASSVLPPSAPALTLHVPQGRHHCIICAPTLCSRPHTACAAGAVPLHHLGRRARRRAAQPARAHHTLRALCHPGPGGSTGGWARAVGCLL